MYFVSCNGNTTYEKAKDQVKKVENIILYLSLISYNKKLFAIIKEVIMNSNFPLYGGEQK